MNRPGRGGSGTDTSVRHSTGDDLAFALERVSLRDYVSRYLEQYGVQIRNNRFRAVWRDGKDENCEIRRSKSGRDYVKDHVSNEFFGTWQWLIRVEKMTPRDAAQRVLHEAGIQNTSNSEKRRVKPNPKIEPTPVPDLSEQLRGWIKTWQYVGGVHFGLDGAKLETLNAFAVWLADALRPYKCQLERIAEGVTLEHCIDAFNGIMPRVCACGKRWTSRLEMPQTDNNGKEFLRLAYGCEPCSELWTAHELENARADFQGGDKAWTHTI